MVRFPKITNAKMKSIQYLQYVLYAEGTRFTLAKHEASIKFCEERSIEPFRNVLYPRTKGAVEVISQLGDSCKLLIVISY